MGLNLYEIKGAQLDILREIQEAEGELTPETEARLMAIDMALDDKLEGCCIVYKNLGAIIEAHENEVKRLNAKRQVFENNQERLKQWISGAVPPEGWKRGVHKLSWRKSKSVEIENVENLPIEFSRMKYEADKTAIKEALEAGATIEGCAIKEKTNLQVK